MNPPELAAGEGASGLRTALDEVHPQARQHRCRPCKTVITLNVLPKSVKVR
jgi:hypothetical protein